LLALGATPLFCVVESRNVDGGDVYGASVYGARADGVVEIARGEVEVTRHRHRNFVFIVAISLTQETPRVVVLCRDRGKSSLGVRVGVPGPPLLTRLMAPAEDGMQLRDGVGREVIFVLGVRRQPIAVINGRCLTVLVFSSMSDRLHQSQTVKAKSW
jgi:hypothetical protein